MAEISPLQCFHPTGTQRPFNQQVSGCNFKKEGLVAKNHIASFRWFVYSLLTLN